MDKALRDQDWIERLTNDADFKKYLERIAEAQKLSVTHRDKIVEALSSPLPRREERAGRIVELTRAELNEQLLLVSATIDATAEVTGWPKAQERRLEDARKELPELKKRIKELKGEN